MAQAKVRPPNAAAAAAASAAVSSRRGYAPARVPVGVDRVESTRAGTPAGTRAGITHGRATRSPRRVPEGPRSRLASPAGTGRARCGRALRASRRTGRCGLWRAARRASGGHIHPFGRSTPPGGSVGGERERAAGRAPGSGRRMSVSPAWPAMRAACPPREPLACVRAPLGGGGGGGGGDSGWTLRMRSVLTPSWPNFSSSRSRCRPARGLRACARVRIAALGEPFHDIEGRGAAAYLTASRHRKINLDSVPSTRTGIPRRRPRSPPPPPVPPARPEAAAASASRWTSRGSRRSWSQRRPAGGGARTPSPRPR